MKTSNSKSIVCSSLMPEMGAFEDWHALFLTPSEYIDLSNLVTSFNDIDFNRKQVLIKAKIVSLSKYNRKREPTTSPYPAILVVGLSDGVNILECDIFRPSDWKMLEVGDSITLLAHLKHNSYRGWYLTSPQREKYSQTPRVDYLGIAGKISGSMIKEAAQLATVSPNNHVRDAIWLERERPMLARIIDRFWGSIPNLLHNLHCPTSVNEGVEALSFVKRLCIAEVKFNAKLHIKCIQNIEPLASLRSEIWEAIKTQAETPSTGQLEALKSAVPALSSNKPARVLLNGDVGSGKTFVFLCIVAGFARLGKRCAIMAPNENVANQIYRATINRFPNLSCKYVTGNSKSDTNDALIWVGTTALIFAKDRPTFDLVVVDEQHKFSREQRESLLSPHSHLIEATATPIPRSLAQALFSGCTLAVIPTPPLKRNLRSHLIDDSQRNLVSHLHKRAISAGQRVIYLYAAVKDGKTNLRAAKAAYKTMSEAFPNKVSIVHGQMDSNTDPSLELEAFKSGEKPILIASTAVEVGIDIPDVRLMVVSDPDRFGIAQLHQIRGRLARNGGDADFVMHTKKTLPKDALIRLNAVKNIHDGFALAKKDLEIRGFGEVAGDAQSGATNTTFKLCKISAADFLK